MSNGEELLTVAVLIKDNSYVYPVQPVKRVCVRVLSL